MKDRHLYNRAVHALMRATVADACHASDYDVIEDLDAAIADLRLWRQHVRARITGDHPSSSNAVRAENIVGGGKRDECES